MKDNLKTFIHREVNPEDRYLPEQLAEMALLVLCYGKHGPDLMSILDQLACPMEEYIAIKDRYHRVLAAYTKSLEGETDD